MDHQEKPTGIFKFTKNKKKKNTGPVFNLSRGHSQKSAPDLPIFQEYDLAPLILSCIYGDLCLQNFRNMAMTKKYQVNKFAFFIILITVLF